MSEDTSSTITVEIPKSILTGMGGALFMTALGFGGWAAMPTAIPATNTTDAELVAHLASGGHATTLEAIEDVEVAVDILREQQRRDSTNLLILCRNSGSDDCIPYTP